MADGRPLAEPLAHMQYIVEEQQRFHAQVQALLATQQDLCAALLTALAEVRDAVAPAPPQGEWTEDPDTR